MILHRIIICRLSRSIDFIYISLLIFKLLWFVPTNVNPKVFYSSNRFLRHVSHKQVIFFVNWLFLLTYQIYCNTISTRLVICMIFRCFKWWENNNTLPYSNELHIKDASIVTRLILTRYICGMIIISSPLRFWNNVIMINAKFVKNSINVV